MQTQTTENLLLQIENLQKRLAQADQLIELIKAGEVDAFAMNKNNKPEVFTLHSGDYAYRVLVENFSEGALNLSEDGLILFANTAFHETLQLSYEKVIGQHISQFIHPDSQETFNELLIKASTGQSKGEINVMAGKKSCPVYVSLASLQPNLTTIGVIVTNLTEKKQIEKDVEVKRKLQNIFQNAPAAIAVFEGPEQKFTLANTAYEKIINRKAADLIGKSLRDVLPELKGTGTFELYDNILKTGESFNAPEYAVQADINNDGVLRQGYFNFSMEPLKNDTGEVYAVLTMTYDITEQVEARKKIEEDAEKLRLNDTIFKTIPDAIIYSDVNGKVITWNEGAEKLYGFSSTEMIGQIMPDMIPTEFTNKEQQNWKEIFAEKGHWKGEVIQTCKDGEKIYVSAVARVIKNNQNEITGYVAVNRNITLQKQAENKINESEVKYRTLFTSIDQGFLLGEIIRNKEGKGIDYFVHQVNPTYEKQTGISAEMVLGKTLLQAFPTVDTWWIDTYAAVVDNQRPVRFERFFEHTNRWFEIKASPSEQDMFTILFSDITERKQNENKIKESESQKTFLLNLSDVLRPLSNPVDIEEAVTKKTRDFMDADWCLYAALDEDLLLIKRDAVREGFQSVAGTYHISNFALFKAILDGGQPFFVDDVHTTDLLDEELKQLCIQLQNISFINVPIIKNGKPVGVLSIVHSKPHKWTATEVQLSIETANRTWAALEKAKAEEALLKSEEKYRMLFDSIDEGVSSFELIFDENDKAVDFTILESNPAMTKLTGLTNEILGKTAKEVLPNLDPFWLETYEQVVKTGKPIRFENKHVDLNNNWFEVYAAKSGDEQSKKVIIVYNNITERKLTEEKIKESEQEIRKIKEQLELSVTAGKIGVWHWDVKNDILYWSNEQKEIYGVSISETITSSTQFNTLINPEDLKRIQNDQSAGDKLEHEYDFRINRKNDGALRWIKSRARNILDEQGALQFISGVNIDVTEEKLFMEKLKEAKESAETAAKSRQQFLSNMSHEIRTPLNSIIGFTNVLFKTELREQQKEFVEAIKTSGKSLNLLINDILDLAKVDAGKMTFEMQPFELHKSITSALHSFDLKIKEKNLKLIKEYDSKIPAMLLGDSVRLNQIILNLISNAVKFTHHGKITLSVKLLNEDQENVNLQFAVADTGIGIPENKINSIFNAFEQSETSTFNSYGGTGLGLAIVKQLIEEQRGSMSLNSKLGEGSTFRFIMPFGKTKIKSEQEIETPKTDVELKNLRVLVAEDVALNQMLIKIILSDFGFEYEIVGNGKLAIEKMQTHTYDIILMDLQMPEMNGFVATEYIRKTLKSQIPIIALTADVTTVDVSKCQEFGMDSYISKPIEEKLLYNKIVELVKKNK